MATAANKAKKAADLPDPSIKSYAYQAMEGKWSMIMTLMGGTEAMRAAERQYLPQHAEESNENYNERLERNTLFNMFELTLDSLVGKPFVEPIKMGDDVPQDIVDMMQDADLQGNDITSFCREWLRDSIAKGFSHCYIDMPKLTTEDKTNRTHADDITEQRRPYWTLIRPENLIFAYAEVVGGVERLTHVRWLETAIEMQGFAEVIKQRIRIIEIGRWELWEFQQTDEKKDPIWVRIDEGTSDLNYIPLVTYYANRSGFMTSKPPLEDLAYLNIRHWQSTSDQINVLTVARFPMLAVSGAQIGQGDQKSMAIGPRQLLATRDANGKYYYVEHSGKAIESGRQDLSDIEDRMASYGAEFLRRKIGGRTATERSLDSSEAISPLRDMVNRFVVSVNRALNYTGDWIGEADGGSVTINTDFTEEDVNTAYLSALGDARKRGDLSRRTFLTELKRLEVVSPDLDVDAEMDQIEHEAKTLVLRPTFVAASETMRTDIQDTGGGPTAEDLLNDTTTITNEIIPKGAPTLSASAKTPPQKRPAAKSVMGKQPSKKAPVRK